MSFFISSHMSVKRTLCHYRTVCGCSSESEKIVSCLCVASCLFMFSGVLSLSSPSFFLLFPPSLLFPGLLPLSSSTFFLPHSGPFFLIFQSVIPPSPPLSLPACLLSSALLCPSPSPLRPAPLSFLAFLWSSVLGCLYLPQAHAESLPTVLHAHFLMPFHCHQFILQFLLSLCFTVLLPCQKN